MENLYYWKILSCDTIDRLFRGQDFCSVNITRLLAWKQNSFVLDLEILLNSELEFVVHFFLSKGFVQEFG